MKLGRSVLLIVLVSALCSCSTASKQPQPGAENWLRDGMIVLARPAPAVAPFDPGQRMLAFMPLPASLPGPWLSIDTQEGLVKLMTGEHALSSFRAEGLENLALGSYQVLHKQKAPLWYAPDRYFESRALSIPPQGDKSRYRKGALGDFVIYIARDIPIHDAPVWSSEVGGIRIPSNEIPGIYERLEVGSPVEIK